jgi:hypothetical protein
MPALYSITLTSRIIYKFAYIFPNAPEETRARKLWTPTLYNAIKNAKRLTEITPYSFTESRWRHFAQVSDFRRGLVPIGDAICRFNPVHGQGMSV